MEERRREPRVRTLTLVDVAEFGPAGLLEQLELGRTLDLSHEGMRIELSHEIPLGREVTVELELGEQIFVLFGTVRSCQPEGTLYHLGLEFPEVASEAYDAIEEWLQLHDAPDARE